MNEMFILIGKMNSTFSVECSTGAYKNPKSETADRLLKIVQYLPWKHSENNYNHWTVQNEKWKHWFAMF